MDQDLKNRLLSKRNLNAAEWDIDEKTLRIVRKGEPASMPTAPEMQTGPVMPIQRTNEQLIAEDRQQRTLQFGNGQSGVVGQDPSIRLQKLADPVGDVESAALSFGSSVLPTLAGLVAGSGATALAAPQTLGGSLAVGIPAGMATSAGAQALQDTLLLNFVPELADKINKAKTANPTTAMLGAAAVPLLTGRPTNPAAVLRALGAQNAVKNPALMRLALGSGVGASINLGQQVAQKASFDKPNLGLGDIDVSEVIEQAALNSLTAGRSYNNRFNRATGIFGAGDAQEAAAINAEKNLTTQGGDKLYTPPKPAPPSVEETIKASPEYLKAQERLKQINKKLDEAALPAQIEEAAKKPFGELEQIQLQDELGIERNPARAVDFEKAVTEENARILNEPAVVQEKAVAQKQAIIKENEDNILNIRLEASKLKLKAAQVEAQRIADSVNAIEPSALVDVGPKPTKPISAVPKELPVVAPEDTDLQMRQIEDSFENPSGRGRQRYASESTVPLEQRAKETGTDTAITKQQLDFWKIVAQKQGANLQVENGTILGADGKPKLGEATSRVAGQEALVRLSSAAGADTVPHELTHVFIDDMVRHGSKSDKSRAQRIVTEIEKTPEYAAWKAKRDEKGFDADGNEFLSDSTGREAFRRLMLDKDNSSFSGAWKDFVAGAKVKWLKNATAADYARFAANSIINGNPTPAGAFKVRGFGSDAGTTVPSKEESVNEQVKLALDKTSTRAAVLLTPGEVFNGNATGLVKAKTKFGDVLFNPSKTTAEAVEAAGKGDNFDARLLGMSQSMKPLSDTVVTTSKNGVKDVQSEQVSPEGVPAAIEAAKKAVPGGEVEVKKVKDVLEHRNASESTWQGRKIRIVSESPDDSRFVKVILEDGSAMAKEQAQDIANGISEEKAGTLVEKAYINKRNSSESLNTEDKFGILEGPIRVRQYFNTGKPVSKTQILKTLEGKISPVEMQFYKDAGIDTKLGDSVTPDELAKFMQENGPRVELHDYGMDGKVSETRKEYDRMTHEWYDNLPNYVRMSVQRAIREARDNGAYENADYNSWKNQAVDDSDGEITHKEVDMYVDLHFKAAKEPADSSPRATSAYESVSAFDTKEPMPEWTKSKDSKNVQRVDVVIPKTKDKAGFQANPNYKGVKTHEADLWSPDNLHENLPNTLGWAMIQYKTGPKGEKVAVIAEAQSRWGQKLREQKDLLKQRDKFISDHLETPPEGFRYQTIQMADGTKGISLEKNNSFAGVSYSGKSKEEVLKLLFKNTTHKPNIVDNDHPLLKDYNRLILKAAIKQAREEGATHIMVSDGETAMMTEMHDAHARRYRETANRDEILPELQEYWNERTKRPEYKIEKTETEDSASGTDFTIVRLDSGAPSGKRKVASLKRGTDNAYVITRKRAEFNNIYKDDILPSPVRFKLDDIVKIEQEGGMRFNYDTALPRIAEDLTGAKGERVSLGEHKNALGKTYTRYNHEAQRYDPEFRSNLIFKNPDGSPKTDVSGIMYPLSGVPETPFTMFGKRHSSESLNTDEAPAPIPTGGKGSYDYVKPLSRVHAWTQPLLNKLASTGKPESYVAQRLEEFTADRVALHGKLVTPVQRAISSLSDESANRVRNFMRLEADGKTPSFSLNAAEKAVQDQIRTTLVDIAEMQKKQGMLVLEKGKAREREIDPKYFPAVIDPEVTREMTQKQGSPKATALRNDFIKFFVENSKGKPDVAKAKAIKELETLFTKGSAARTPEFAALTTPAGFGLPDSWQSKNLDHIMTTYAERSANALSYDRHIVSDPTTRKLLRIQEDNKGEKTKFDEIKTLPDGTDISGVFLDQNDSVKAAMRHVTRDYSEKDAMYNVVSRAVKASIMQLPAGARDIVSTPAIAAQLLKPSEIPILAKALGSISKGYEEGLKNGTIRLNTIGAQDEMFNDNAAFKYLDRYATAVNKYGGREYAERFSRAYMNTIGGMLYDSRVAAGDKASLKAFIPNDGVERTPQEERSYAIARMVESVQGAYDIRGLPASALEGPLQTILSLTKWSIERQNNFTKHVIKPARNGNYVPLLTSVFGGILSGVAIQKLNQWISKSKPPEVTPEEYMNLNDDHAYFWISMASYSSILGLQANLAKSGMDFTKTGRTKFGIGDPVLGLGGDVAGTIKDAIEAYQVNGEMNFGIELTKSLASTLSENARAVLKYTDDQTERADKRDKKLFERLTNDDTKPSTVIDVNPFANVDEKKFDREQDMDKAKVMAGELMGKAFKKAKTMEDLDRSLTKLRTMPKEPIPDPFNDTKEFAEYFQFLRQIYSEDEAMEKVKEAQRKRATNEAKKKLIFK